MADNVNLAHYYVDEQMLQTMMAMEWYDAEDAR